MVFLSLLMLSCGNSATNSAANTPAVGGVAETSAAKGATFSESDSDRKMTLTEDDSKATRSRNQAVKLGAFNQTQYNNGLGFSYCNTISEGCAKAVADKIVFVDKKGNVSPIDNRAYDVINNGDVVTLRTKETNNTLGGAELKQPMNDIMSALKYSDITMEFTRDRTEATITITPGRGYEYYFEPLSDATGAATAPALYVMNVAANKDGVKRLQGGIKGSYKVGLNNVSSIHSSVESSASLSTDNVLAENLVYTGGTYYALYNKRGADIKSSNVNNAFLTGSVLQLAAPAGSSPNKSSILASDRELMDGFWVLLGNVIAGGKEHKLVINAANATDTVYSANEAVENATIYYIDENDSDKQYHLRTEVDSANSDNIKLYLQPVGDTSEDSRRNVDTERMFITKVGSAHNADGTLASEIGQYKGIDRSLTNTAGEFVNKQAITLKNASMKDAKRAWSHNGSEWVTSRENLLRYFEKAGSTDLLSGIIPNMRKLTSDNLFDNDRNNFVALVEAKDNADSVTIALNGSEFQLVHGKYISNYFNRSKTDNISAENAPLYVAATAENRRITQSVTTNGEVRVDNMAVSDDKGTTVHFNAQDNTFFKSEDLLESEAKATFTATGATKTPAAIDTSKYIKARASGDVRIEESNDSIKAHVKYEFEDDTNSDSNERVVYTTSATYESIKDLDS